MLTDFQYCYKISTKYCTAYMWLLLLQLLYRLRLKKKIVFSREKCIFFPHSFGIQDEKWLISYILPPSSLIISESLRSGNCHPRLSLRIFQISEEKRKWMVWIFLFDKYRSVMSLFTKCALTDYWKIFLIFTE